MRLPFAATLVVALFLPAPSPHAAGDPWQETFASTIQPAVAEYCYGCHNDTKRKGNLTLKPYLTAASVLADPNTWDVVVGKLRTGEMPPADEPRPDSHTLNALTAWIEQAVEEGDRRAPPDPGRVTVRRLNRTEYNNTVRDLLGVVLRPADEFPQDDTGYGFDTIGDVLSVPPVLMERYLVAAERVARAAVVGPEHVKPTLARYQPRARTLRPQPTVPAAYDETGVSLPNAVHATHRFPNTGTYVVKVYTGGTRPASSEPIRLAVWIDGTEAGVEALDPEGAASFFDDKQDFSGKVREFRLQVPAGEHWVAATIPGLFEGLPASYGGPRPSTRPVPPPPVFVPPADATPERIERARQRFEEKLAETVPANDVRVTAIEIAGPYDVPRGPSPDSRTLVYTCGRHTGPHGAACARAILWRLSRRAYRRPVPAAELEQLLRLYRSARRDGEPFEEALIVALQGILVSPDFLFRLETGPATATPGNVRLTDHQLAARLSYFLWASMPDRHLFQLADAGRLHDPAVLDAEVRRMLQDAKARTLVEEFGGQWLQIRALESAAPDKERFPAFDDYLRLSMRRETELFFERIIREDRSILEFLDARWTFLNERLATHYGVPDVHGPEFRPVVLPMPTRGGIFTQASVLTVSSYATRTSPVLRGKWILENLLHAPPPDPPPGTGTIEGEKPGAALSVRQQLEAHRANPTCASCHRRMDPLGFGLENYDAIGAWRDAEGELPIDSTGQLPDGRTFRGPAELRAILSAEREAFARALTAKLLTYALGRGLERYDGPTVRAIARGVADQDYRFSALVLAIVKSTPFQMRRGDTP